MKKLSKKKVKERRKKGIVKAYISRAAAVKKLQVSLADFRRLCILKGVYPVEPKNKSKLTGANTRRKTYFFTRDIQMLMNEPLLFKFWEFKVFMKRLTRSKGRHDLETFQKTIDSKPFYKLDTIVKERYPRFIDALRDCDDGLSMCFLFAMFPKSPARPDDLIDLSRKLTIEFMHYIMNSKSLRKVFISIKGYYYQAEIMGQTITWIVPHQFVIDRVSNVDLNVMKTFTEFYITLLGFINYRLYKTLNAVYPPQVVAENLGDFQKTKDLLNDSIKNQSKKRRRSESNQELESLDSRDELIGALNKKIRILDNKSISKMESADQQPDVFDELEESEKAPSTDAAKKGNETMTVQDIMALERLFEGLKFFLNREVPRESLTFIIRSFGGEVSWDTNLFAGATFAESDPSITHQIVDRPMMPERRLDRIYVQPQWVYDSINVRMLLPTTDYLIGSTLPPHLSPFVNEKRGDYVPPDKVKLMNLRKQFEAEKASEQRVKKGLSGVESDLETDNELEAASAISDLEDDAADKRPSKKFRSNAETDKDDIDSFDSKRSRDRATKNRKRRERDSNKSTSRSKMSVRAGKLKIEDKAELDKKEDAEYRKMGIMMIPKKKKRLFDKITRTQKQRKQKTEKLRTKRRIVDAVKSRNTRSRT